MNYISKIGIGIALLGIVACGAEKPKASDKESELKETKKVQQKEQEVIEITVRAVGESMAEIAFEPASINVPSGSKVKLTFENKSSAAGMLHNFVLVELGSGQDIASAGIKAGKDNSFVPKDKRVVFYTDVLYLGESQVYEFNAPSKGSYHFICTFPGHYPSMIGRLNVQ